MLRCKATVVRCSSLSVGLKLVQETACTGCIKTICHTTKNCVAINKTNIIQIPVTKKAQYKLGDEVELVFRENEIIKITMAWFILPLIALFLTLAVMTQLVTSPTDWQIAKAGVVSLICGLLMAKAIIYRRNKKSPYWFIENNQKEKS